MIRVYSRFAPFLLALFALLPILAIAQATSAAAPASLLLRFPSLAGQDRLPLRRRHLDGGAEGRRGRAAHLQRQGDAGPFYSPDGAWIAYSAHLNGNTDAYVIPATGGVPRRITWHPAAAAVVGWSPDGKDVLIDSSAASYRHFDRLFRVHADGSGVPEPLPLPSGSRGLVLARWPVVAYQPFSKWQPAWKRYVGGQTTPIWIVNLKTLDLVKVPRENSNDSNPVWVGDQVYFLSDRDSTGRTTAR
jgi:tricorn protease